MKILLLEDDLTRIKQFKERFVTLPNVENITYTDTAQNCIELLKSNEYDMIFLDHDLGGEVFVKIEKENTGSEVARFIKENPLKNNPIIIIHTLNPDGAKYMLNTIKTANTFYIPFIWVKKTFDERIKTHFITKEEDQNNGTFILDRTKN